jgi:ethanolamine ammonia-lyase large subunit
MAGYTHSVGGTNWRFDSLREVMAKASPARSGDFLAGSRRAATPSASPRRCAWRNIPLKRFLEEALIPYETDEVTRLIIDSHDKRLRSGQPPDRRRFSQLAAGR